VCLSLLYLWLFSSEWSKLCVHVRARVYVCTVIASEDYTRTSKPKIKLLLDWSRIYKRTLMLHLPAKDSASKRRMHKEAIRLNMWLQSLYSVRSISLGVKRRRLMAVSIRCHFFFLYWLHKPIVLYISVCVCVCITDLLSAQTRNTECLSSQTTPAPIWLICTCNDTLHVHKPRLNRASLSHTQTA